MRSALINMSRAFVKEPDGLAAFDELPERLVSPHPNLVTETGLAQIESEVARLSRAYADAQASGDRAALNAAARDLRYWTARRESAELSEPEPGGDVVRFGMSVTIEDEAGKRKTWKIVGEDEADAAKGSVSHVSPMAQALFGRRVGDVVTVAGREWEVVALG